MTDTKSDDSSMQLSISPEGGHLWDYDTPRPELLIHSNFDQALI